MPTLLGWHDFPTLYWKAWGPTTMQHYTVGSGTFLYLCQESSSHLEDDVAHVLSQRVSAPLEWPGLQTTHGANASQSKERRQWRSRQLWIATMLPQGLMSTGVRWLALSLVSALTHIPIFPELTWKGFLSLDPFIVLRWSKPWEDRPTLWDSSI